MKPEAGRSAKMILSCRIQRSVSIQVRQSSPGFQHELTNDYICYLLLALSGTHIGTHITFTQGCIQDIGLEMFSLGERRRTSAPIYIRVYTALQRNKLSGSGRYQDLKILEGECRRDSVQI